MPTLQHRVPDGRLLDLFLGGPEDAVRIPGSRQRLFAEHGHLTLAVDSAPRIVDELLALDR